MWNMHLWYWLGMTTFTLMRESYRNIIYQKFFFEVKVVICGYNMSSLKFTIINNTWYMILLKVYSFFLVTPFAKHMRNLNSVSSIKKIKKNYQLDLLHFISRKVIARLNTLRYFLLPQKFQYFLIKYKNTYFGNISYKFKFRTLIVINIIYFPFLWLYTLISNLFFLQNIMTFLLHLLYFIVIINMSIYTVDSQN